MGRMDGKVALVTGAARGQGRSHAIRLAEEGADIIATDLCGQLATVEYLMGTRAELEETVRAVERLDRRIFTGQADVRVMDELQAVVDEGVKELGRLDVVCANAGISTQGISWELTEQQWDETVDTNLAGVWHTVKATVPTLIEQDEGGSIVVTGSTASIMGFGGVLHYTAAKHGALGIVKALVNEVSRYRIRVNMVVPTATNTPMIQNDGMRELFGVSPDAPMEEYEAAFQAIHTLPVPWMEPVDISNAVLWLASDEARYVTGSVLQVDAGFCTKVG
jgi:SDR family mycofactocin-dependent oxidoreductase